MAKIIKRYECDKCINDISCAVIILYNDDGRHHFYKNDIVCPISDEKSHKNPEFTLKEIYTEV